MQVLLPLVEHARLSMLMIMCPVHLTAIAQHHRVIPVRV